MKRIEDIKRKLKMALSDKRFNHSIRVAKQTVILAKRFGADAYKAELAGLLHDCAKGLSIEDALKRADNFGIILDDDTRGSPGTIHGIIGEMLAKSEYNIKDREILDAIRYHTTGRRNMSLLEKIVFIADYTEPCRDFPGVDDVREILKKDINRAVQRALERNIISLIERNMHIHPDTIEARNYLLI